MLVENINLKLSKMFDFRIAIKKKWNDITHKNQPIYDILSNDAEIINRLHSICELIEPHKVKNKNKIRVGGNNDGGYILIDEFKYVTSAISLGIGREVSWDVSISNKVNHVYQYDHTIDELPVNKENFIFKRMKIGIKDKKNEIRLDSLIDSVDGSRRGSLIVKMDIEGGEWDVINAVNEKCFDSVAQFIVEFHGIRNITDEKHYFKMFSVFDKLSKHFRVVHVHGNNYENMIVVGNNTISNVIEIKFVNKELFEFEDSKVIFPTNLDSPNKRTRDDHNLGYFKFS